MALNEGIYAFYYALSFIITLSVISLFVTLLIDFAFYGDKSAVKINKRSIVATSSIAGFYAVYYAVLQLGWGSFSFVYRNSADLYVNFSLIIFAAAMIVAGAAVNILGRLQLKNNWSNQIKIYKEHALITRGVYKMIRHPLYTSIMLMLCGGCLAYKNILCVALTAFVFVPFMYYRARQEESLLRAEFSEYARYMADTGMFFPKLRKIK